MPCAIPEMQRDPLGIVPAQRTRVDAAPNGHDQRSVRVIGGRRPYRIGREAGRRCMEP